MRNTNIVEKNQNINNFFLQNEFDFKLYLKLFRKDFSKNEPFFILFKSKRAENCRLPSPLRSAMLYKIESIIFGHLRNLYIFLNKSKYGNEIVLFTIQRHE
jgi:hypothetical protein